MTVPQARMGEAHSLRTCTDSASYIPGGSMTRLRALPMRFPAAIAFILISSLTSTGQTSTVPARVTQPVDVEQLVTLQGNTHPQARPEFDQGAAPDSLPMERVLLVLQRSPKQDAELRELLEEQQTKSSPNYHMWLTPEQFGQRFGPADADVQVITDWLTSRGFQVNRVANGRTVIEFSGTAGTVRQALHTEIHKFAVHGEEHWANAGDPQIPAALRPVVAGFASLNNFPRKPLAKLLGAFSRSTATGKVTPLFTVPTSNGNYYVLGPYDFATIYDVLPLWQASPAINGSGQTIAIVASSNINTQDVSDFRSLFGLPPNVPQIIVNGVDPGVTGDEDESEADLDTEWSGAVAPNATIDLVVSETTESTFGADLSAVYIVDNNLAPILSASYGACEAALGDGGNAFYNALWGQGAAQGITILVASGDDGSAGCDNSGTEAAAQYGLMVSGTASTPFNTAVGGTDFNDVDNWSTYWSSTNNSTTLASALSYIPETTWNASCARSGQASDCANAGSGTPAGIDLVAAGGGASACTTSTSSATSFSCSGGYPKPPWQSGTGVPQDGARDLPDVSLFASNGVNNSFYLVCEADALQGGISCDKAIPEWGFLGAGGTSASTPAFAGIMAMVDQKMGERQGNANYVLYPLAAKSSCASTASMAPSADTSNCIFYDVITGNNSVACQGGTPNCSSRTSGSYGLLEVSPATDTTPAWTTTAGYDLATGLGSVNAANLVNNWSSVSFRPTTTTLASLSPTSLTHGQAVNFTVNVAPGSGSGTPLGNVSLIAQAGVSSTNVTGIGPFTLSGGTVTSSTNMLPGGTYGVTAHYAGNGTFGASDSTPPIQVTVGKESSQTKVGVVSCNYTNGACTYGVTSMVYGTTYGFQLLRMDVTNASGQPCASPTSGVLAYPCPTGIVTATMNGEPPSDLGNPIDDRPGTYPLNSEGYTEDQYIQLPGGTYDIVASYAGDNSYTASTSPQSVVTITKAPTTITGCTLPSTAQVGIQFSCTATVNTQSYGRAPTGTIGLFAGTTPILGGGDVSGTNGTATTYASFQETYYPIFQQGGTFSVTQQYSGDAYYLSSTTSPAVTINVADFSVSSNPATVTIAAPGQSGTSTITITPVAGFTGTLTLGCTPSNTSIGCAFSPSSVTLTGTSATTVTLTVTTAASPSATLPTLQRNVPPGFGLSLAWFWPLAGLLGLAILLSLATARRRAAGWLFAIALFVVGVWAACGGGGGSEGGNPPASPVASLSTLSLSFGQQNTGTSSAVQSVVVSNTGNASLNISGITMGGADPADFTQTNSCGSSVAAGANCTISVTFKPTATGSRSASVSITDNASGSPQTVSLSGTGLGTPAATLSPSTLSFGPQLINTVSAKQSVTLTNTGNGVLTITGVYLLPVGQGSFNGYNGCDSTLNLAPAANCSIQVTFNPTVAGSYSATLSVTDNAPGSPQTTALIGTGALPPTSPGTYSVQVGASNGPDSHFVNVQVVVQ